MKTYVYKNTVATITLFFSQATPGNVAAALDEVAEQFQVMNSDPVEWLFPTSENWRVVARLHDNALASYAAGTRELLQAQVGIAPSAVLNVVLHHRAIGEACDAARILAVHLLERFHGVVDDQCSDDRIWNIEEIERTKAGIKFLDCYRTRQRRAG